VAKLQHSSWRALPQRNRYARIRRSTSDSQKFLNAAHDREIIFVRGGTEAINLVASSYGRANIGAGDEVIISAMEHHAGIVPWQMLCDSRAQHCALSQLTITATSS
jgi:selenocysteine lyase/cysteine desulfurase